VRTIFSSSNGVLDRNAADDEMERAVLFTLCAALAPDEDIRHRPLVARNHWRYVARALDLIEWELSKPFRSSIPAISSLLMAVKFAGRPRSDSD